MIKLKKIHLPDMDKISQRIDSVTAKSLNEITDIIGKSIESEAPSSTGKLKKSRKNIRARKVGKVFKSQIKMAYYALDLNKGITESENIFHNSGDKMMTFPESKWPKGTKGYYRQGFFWNGRYFFKRVKYVLKKNDFITRGYRKVSTNTIYKNIFDNISVVFK